MDWDEPVSKKTPRVKDLAPLSITDLEAYIAEMKAEIARTEAEITRRGGHKSAAEALFRK